MSKSYYTTRRSRKHHKSHRKYRHKSSRKSCCKCHRKYSRTTHRKNRSHSKSHRKYSRKTHRKSKSHRKYSRIPHRKSKSHKKNRYHMRGGDRDSVLRRAGVSGYNRPKRTPSHPTKSHIVVAKEGNRVKTIRFGQQGVSGSPKRKGESEYHRRRRNAFRARHAKNIAKGKMSAAYWANKVKW